MGREPSPLSFNYWLKTKELKKNSERKDRQLIAAQHIPFFFSEDKKKKNMTAFEEYVDQYGYNFNKKLYEFAVSLMRDRNGSGIKALPKEQVTEWLKTQGVTLNNDRGYNAAYIYAMAKADYLGSSIKDNVHLALFVKDYIDDPDGNPERAFDGFVMSCRAKGEMIDWQEMI